MNKLQVGDIVYRVTQGQLQTSTISEVRPQSFFVRWGENGIADRYNRDGDSLTDSGYIFMDEYSAMQMVLAFERLAAMKVRLQAERKESADLQAAFSELGTVEAAKRFTKHFPDEMAEYLCKYTAKFNLTEWRKLMAD